MHTKRAGCIPNKLYCLESLSVDHENKVGLKFIHLTDYVVFNVDLRGLAGLQRDENDINKQMRVSIARVCQAVISLGVPDYSALI